MEIIFHIYVVLMPSAIVALWVWFKKRSDACEKDRKQLWLAVAHLSGIARAARACPVVNCELRQQAHEVVEETEDGLNPDHVRQKVIRELGVKDIALSPHYSVAQ